MIASVLTIAACFPTAVGAQASAYVPLDDIAYKYVDALMARGQLWELSALERPYTVRAVRAAIDSARVREVGAVASSYLDALEGTVRKYAVRPQSSDTADTQNFRARGTVNGYVIGQTSGRRELMLPAPNSGVEGGGSIRLVMAGGPVVGFVRTLIDTRLNADPDFAGRKDRRIGGRTEDGYVAGQWKYGELSFGRVGRNWGPASESGLMLGNYAYTYDHLYGAIGTDRIHFSSVIARLDDIAQTAGPNVQRYFSIHRLALRLGNWELAGSESYLYGGAGRSFDPSLANPFNIYGLSWRNEQKEGNLGLGAEASFRSRRLGTLSGQVFLDDVQIDRSCDPACKQPSSYGVTLTADGLPLVGDHRWFASYTRVSNLAYNNKNPDEHYEIFGLSLGRGFSDYDQLKAGLDLALLPGTPLRFYVAHRRQGEGNVNRPFPDPSQYAATPAIFSGIVMGVTRVALSGARRWRELEISGDLGVNHSANDQHVAGVTATSVVGRLMVSIEPRWSVNF